MATTQNSQAKLDAINELLETVPANYSPSYWEDADDVSAMRGKQEFANKIRAILADPTA